jgi:hypothetical protein
MFDIKNRYIKNNSSDIKTINISDNVFSSNSRKSKIQDNSKSNKYPKIIINHLNSSKPIPTTVFLKNNKRKDINEISGVKLIPKRLINLSDFSSSNSLKNLGKQSIDCQNLIGLKINLSKNNKREREQNSFKNKSFISIKNEYAFKLSNIAESFNKLEKYRQYISEDKQYNFNETFFKLKKKFNKQISFLLDFYDDIDMKSNLIKQKDEKIKFLPRIKTMANLPNENYDIITIENKDNKKSIIITWYEICYLMNKFLAIILQDLSDSKFEIKKLNLKIHDYEILTENNKKDIDNLKKLLVINETELESSAYQKYIKIEKKLNEIKTEYNQNENKYILNKFKMEEEIKALTLLLEKNQNYFDECKELKKEIINDKKKNKDLNYILRIKNEENSRQRIVEEDLLEKINNLNKVIADLKKDGNKRDKNDIENQKKLKQLNDKIDEKNENIKKLNEKLDLYMNELNKEKRNIEMLKKNLSFLENKNDKNITQNQNQMEINETNNNNDIINKKEREQSFNSNVNNNNYSIDDKNKENESYASLN